VDGDATTPADAPVDLLSLAAAMEEAGIPEVVPNLLALFHEELGERRSAIVTALEANEPDDVAAAAHSLKSAAGNIHADDLHRALVSLEQAARAGQPLAEPGLTALEEIDRVDRFLTDEVAG
jgi:HPt (histidine-containing phosphotransfer) domain-containing protein